MLLPHQITGRLLDKGIRVSDVADVLDLDPSTISTIITKKGTSARVQEYIAAKLGESFESVWGPRRKTRRRSKRV